MPSQFIYRKIKYRHQQKGKIEIEGLSENICTSIDQITAFLNTAQLNKHVGVTDMNAKSSRSHTM